MLKDISYSLQQEHDRFFFSKIFFFLFSNKAVIRYVCVTSVRWIMWIFISIFRIFIFIQILSLDLTVKRFTKTRQYLFSNRQTFILTMDGTMILPWIFVFSSKYQLQVFFFKEDLLFEFIQFSIFSKPIQNLHAALYLSSRDFE